MLTSKLCSICGVLKPASEYHLRTDSIDGRYYACLSCTNRKARASYQKRRAAIADVDVRWIEWQDRRLDALNDQLAAARQSARQVTT